MHFILILRSKGSHNDTKYSLTCAPIDVVVCSFVRHIAVDT